MTRVRLSQPPSQAPASDSESAAYKLRVMSFINALLPTPSPPPPPTLKSLFSGVWEVSRLSAEGALTTHKVHLTSSVGDAISGDVFLADAEKSAAPTSVWTVKAASGGGSLHGVLLEARGGGEAQPLCDFDFSGARGGSSLVMASASSDCRAIFAGARDAGNIFSRPSVWAEPGASFVLMPGNAELGTITATRIASIAEASQKTFYQRYGWWFNIALLLGVNFYIRACTRKRLRKNQPPKDPAERRAALQSYLRSIRESGSVKSEGSAAAPAGSAAAPAPAPSSRGSEPVAPSASGGFKTD
jgi:hypothetical protein